MSAGKSICIIGAGPCGLATIKNMKDQGFTDIVCHEPRETVGGIWNHTKDASRASVYDSAHIISSRRLSAFRGFPMPEAYPDYPSHEQILAYFSSYAQANRLTDHIRFGSRVVSARQREQGGWTIVSKGPEGDKTEAADVLVVANGHHSEPFVPELPGNFTGEQIHSVAYRCAEPFRGKRVLVVGAGNSACDIAAVLSRVAGHVSLSMRHAQAIIPKLVFGRPVDVQFAKLQILPRPLREMAAKLAVGLAVGPYRKYGLKEPEGALLSMHPTLNSDILDRIRHGKVTPREGIKSADGSMVEFENGDNAEFDVIIWATGFRMAFPFFEAGFPAWQNALEIPLYLKMMPAGRDDLFFIGLIQPIGCIWALADYQAELAARLIAGTWTPPNNVGERIKRQMAMDARQFERSARHAVQVDFHDYKRKLEAELARAA